LKTNRDRYKRKIKSLQTECRELQVQNALLSSQSDLDGMSLDIIDTAKILVETLVRDRADIEIVLNQPRARLQSYLVAGTDSNPTASAAARSSNDAFQYPQQRFVPSQPVVPLSLQSPANSSHSVGDIDPSRSELELRQAVASRHVGSPTALLGPPEPKILPQSEDAEGYIIRDRNDGRGPREEYGQQRKSRGKHG
jgi:hypothetical protein